jgi:hypothetical protein
MNNSVTGMIHLLSGGFVNSEKILEVRKDPEMSLENISGDFIDL